MKVIRLAYSGVLIGYVSAQAQPTITSIYIPGTDPQSLSVDVLGVGSDGATTYFIQPADGNDSSFPETLVENASHASLHAVGTLSPGSAVDLTEDCAIGSDGLASCTAVLVIGGTTSTNIDTETASPIPVVLGSVASSGSSSSSGGTSLAPSSSSGPGSKPTGATSGSTPTANPGSTPTSPPTSTSPAGGSTTSNAPQPTTNGAIDVRSLTTGLVAMVVFNLFGVFML